MIFTETPLSGAYVIDLEPHEDERGSFARTFSQDEFADHGLDPVIAQVNVAVNRRRGTVRGMHFQFPPSAEPKYVRCTRGAMYDVIVDLRPESATYLRHTAVELADVTGRGLYIPKRFAHGYQSLVDDTETTYMIGAFHAPNDEGGLPHDDAALAIDWPLPVAQLSLKDRAWRPLAEAEPRIRHRMMAAVRV